LTMLNFLYERRARVPIEYTLVAAHLDMGYENPVQTAALKEYVSRLDIETHFEVTGYALRAHSKENRKNPCFFCSRLRRRRLFELARDYGCSKVALGHNRDDLIETLLLNIFYSGEISSMLPVQELFDGFLTVIRPMFLVPEAVIRRETAEQGLPIVENPCPSADRSKRNEVKAIIARLAESNDKVRGNIFRSLSNYRPDHLLSPGQGFDRAGPGRVRGRRKSRNKEKFAMDENKRKRTRVDFQTSVKLKAGGKELEGLESRDISLKGLYVDSKDKFSLDTLVEISLDLSGTTSSLSLSMEGRVARVDDKGMGVDFTRIDMDSFFHLRNLVSYNFGDFAEVDSELAGKPGF
ncbi:MAG: PilZ domain-containing protein, partial [Thermodesulfobacteriota bacterium]|nr:PilZ domain-containing protein [Thermodesulfobacteriota bacterium]